MKIKQTILVFIIGLTSVNAIGQSIKDYFLPDSTHNKASFYMPSETGERSGITRTIFYINKGITYDITSAHWFDG